MKAGDIENCLRFFRLFCFFLHLPAFLFHFI